MVSTQDIVSRLLRIDEIKRTIMQPNVHFGIIPGCAKPSLFQPGAEMLGVAFNIGAGEPIIEDLSVPGESARYRVKIPLIAQQTGQTLGWGMGECSSDEDKYRWRKCLKSEFDQSDPGRRRMKGDRDGTFRPQIRTEPAGMANTALQMASKRAYVSGMRRVTGASSVFTDGVEDLASEIIDVVSTAPARETATAATLLPSAPPRPAAPAVAEPVAPPPTATYNPGSLGYIMEANSETVNSYLVKLGWIGPEQTWEALPANKQTRIEAGMDRFLDAARGAK